MSWMSYYSYWSSHHEPFEGSFHKTNMRQTKWSESAFQAGWNARQPEIDSLEKRLEVAEENLNRLRSNYFKI